MTQTLGAAYISSQEKIRATGGKNRPFDTAQRPYTHSLCESITPIGAISGIFEKIRQGSAGPIGEIAR